MAWLSNIFKILAGLVVGSILLKLLAKWLLNLPITLLEDAVVQWINDQIAQRFDIASPSVKQVVNFIGAWMPYAVFTAVLLSGWLAFGLMHRRHRATAVPERLLSQPAPAPAPPPQLGVPDWTIRELFRYYWPEFTSSSMRDDPAVTAAADDLVDRFSTGQIKVWGRPIKRRTGPLSPIDQTYWGSSFARFTFYFLDEPEDDPYHTKGNPDYRDLRVNRAEAIAAIGPSPAGTNASGVEIVLRPRIAY